jgi:GntR family transcriptional regulator
MQIMHHVQAAVASGQLKEGDQLPTIRALRVMLDVNPNTVARAYRELQHLGVITAEHGSGYYVALVGPSRLPALSGKEKKAKLQELCRRFSAEARGHGISAAELLAQLQRQKTA